MKTIFSYYLFILLGLAWPKTVCQAQWTTETFTLTNGWNAIYLHVDASHTNITELAGPNSPIAEIWFWNPSPAAGQFISDPAETITLSSQWMTWTRDLNVVPTLNSLIGNAAYLVKITNASTFTWQVKGRPVPPRYHWSVSGLNLIGFSTVPSNAPFIRNFLDQSPGLGNTTEIYRYVGGELSTNVPMNPAPLPSFLWNSTRVTRGQAFWMRRVSSSDLYNRYYGPFEIDLTDYAGLRFGPTQARQRIRLRNVTTNELKLTMQLLPSQTPPQGQKAIAGTPTLLVRGSLNATNLTYGFSTIATNGSTNWTLAAAGQSGSELDVVIGLERTKMGTNAGSFWAGILRFRDTNLNFMQWDVPVSGEVGSTTGLWVGMAAITNVDHYIKNYQTNGDGSLYTSTNSAEYGQYVSTSTNTSPGATARDFPLRLILHRNAAGQFSLLQRVYYGPAPGTNAGAIVLATKETSLSQTNLSDARRISAPHLPWTRENNPIPCVGDLRIGTNLQATVTLAYDDQASNPFLHTYHPDHDNLRPDFKATQATGVESYGVTRQITFTLNPAASDFDGLTSGTETLAGNYEEVITFTGRSSQARTFRVRGVFALERLSDIGTLTTQ